jgi:DNA-binding transcriptional regulator YdaS (Cro superfamily)
MKKLLDYLNRLTPPEQAEFARRSGTTVGYLRKAISTGQRIGETICINLERESGRAVVCEDLRSDVDWAFIRNTPAHRSIPDGSLNPQGAGA